MAKRLTGAFDAQSISEVETLVDTFSITVKNDEDVVVFTDKKSEYTYHKVPSLQTALELFGASLDDSQKQFLTEALSGGENTGKSVLRIIGIVNDALQAEAKSKAYAKLLNQHKPETEESMGNAFARMVRMAVKTSGAEDTVVIENLHKAATAGLISFPADYTVEMFRANKSKV